MFVVGALPLFLLLAVAFVVGVVGLGVFAAISVARKLGVLEGDGRLTLPGTKAGSGRPAITAPASDGPKRGRQSRPDPDEEIRSTPRRLGQLERQLGDALERADQQASHLRDRRRRIEDKQDRTELVARYDEDVELLGRRAQNMRRVMALLWRTRAILELRAHIAISARRRPDLAHLPDGEVPKADLEAAADAYDRASEAVRQFVSYIDERSTDLRMAVPHVPEAASVDDDDRSMVDAEQVETAGTYTALQDRMDRLADTLGYLADRCRTRAVVAGSEVHLEAGAGTEGLLSEVAEALSGLQEMSRIGDQQLAESALDNLAEDISQLERAGLNARAAAEAELEIARLLEHVPA
jgi:hypothetical protein